MLYIVKQYKSLFLGFLFNTLIKGEELSAWLSKENADKTKDFLQKNKEDILKYLKSLDKSGTNGMDFSDWILSHEELSWQADKKALNDILDKLGLSSMKLDNNINLGLVIDAINKYIWEKQDIIDTTREQLWEWDITWTWWYKLDINEMRNNVNLNSFNKIIKSVSFSELDSFMQEVYIAREPNKNTETWGYNFNPFNIWELKEIFEKAWYEADWFFGWEEMASLIQLFKNVHETQKTINDKQTTFKDKLAIIFDYNIDGILDNDIHFTTKEKQIFDAIESEKQFESLLKNLGYSDINEFNLTFADNYFKAREDFKSNLNRVLMPDFESEWQEYHIDPALLINNPEGKKKVYEKLNEALEYIDSSEKLKWVSQIDKARINSYIVWLYINTGGDIWIWAWMNIKEFTKGVLDQWVVTVYNWMPGFAVNKEIISSSKWSVNVWVANFVPFVAATAILKEAKLSETTNLEQLEFEDDMQVTVAWGLSPTTKFVWVDFTKVTETTKSWIEQAVSQMGEFLDPVLENIKNGKEFSQTWLNTTDEALYNKFVNLYKSGGENNVSLNQLKEWIIRNYKNTLVIQAQNEGWQFTWGGLSLVLVAWYLPLPVIFGHWEKFLDTKWNQVKTITLDNAWELVSVDKLSDRNKIIKTEANEHVSFNEVADENFKEKVDWIRKYISPRIRFNESAQRVINPSLSMEERFQGLKDLRALANKNKHKAESDTSYRGAWYLAKSELWDMIEAVDNENKKLYLLSSVTQFIKVSDDITNKSVEEKISIDKGRREAYNTAFWFDASEYAELYYSNLKAAKTTTEATVQGFALDATSTIVWYSSDWKEKKTISWVDALYWNLKVENIDWKFAGIKLDSSKYSDLSLIIWSNELLTHDQKETLSQGFNAWKIEAYFYKDPIWFDDRILFVRKWTVDWWVISWNTIDVFTPEYNHLQWWVAVSWEVKKEKKDSISSTPWEQIDSTVDQNWEATWPENTIEEQAEWPSNWFTPPN